MLSLNYLSDTNLKAANSFDGVLSLLLYDPAATVFEQKFRASYPQLHARSGDSLLVIAGQSDWLPRKLRSQVAAEFSRRAPSGFMEMMIAPTKLNPIDEARRTMNLTTRFGLEPKQLPCLVMLERLDDSRGVVIGFDRTTINSATDDLQLALVEAFDIINAAAKRDPCPVTPYDAERSAESMEAMIKWRRKIIESVQPQFRRLSFKTFIKKNVPNIISGAGGLAGLL
jgi:hypothetical protein